MFEQTFVDIRERGKPYSIGVSLVLQMAALGILVLIPLIYTQALPNAQLKSLMTASAPPHAAPPRTAEVARARSHSAARVFNTHVLVAPHVIPKGVAKFDDSAPPPDVGGIDVTGPADVAPGGIIGSIPSVTPSYPPPHVQPKAPKRAPVPIGGVVAEANLIHRVQPSYPPLAKSARVEGTVEFSAIISKDGFIENLQLKRGHPLLVAAARDAVLQWRYRPTLLNGQPVEVVTDIIVNFTLAR